MNLNFILPFMILRSPQHLNLLAMDKRNSNPQRGEQIKQALQSHCYNLEAILLAAANIRVAPLFSVEAERSYIISSNEKQSGEVSCKPARQCCQLLCGADMPRARHSEVPAHAGALRQVCLIPKLRWLQIACGAIYLCGSTQTQKSNFPWL